MFDLESRKNNTKIIVDLTSKWMLYFSKNKIIAGWLAVSIHIIFGVFIIFNLLKKKVNAADKYEF